MKKFIALFSLLLFCSAIGIKTANWQTVPNAKVNFTIDGIFGIDVRGTLSDLKSNLEFYPEDVSNSNIQVTINVSSVNTKNKKRDKHLKTSDFFDVEKFPIISFSSNSFRKIGEYFVVEGNLTLKDVTKAITIPFEFIQQGDSAVFRGDFNLNRLDYNVGKKSRMMGNEVRVHLNIPVKPIN